MNLSRGLLLLVASCCFIIGTATHCAPSGSTTLLDQPATPLRPPRTPLPGLDDLPAAEPTAPAGERARVTRIYDGDTIDVELGGQTYRLRYIGIDSPEREEPFYEEASDFNRQMVEDQTVILVRDVSDTDQYGRLLRYVYLLDGTFINAQMIRNGMARLVTFPPDVAQTDYLRGLQAEAEEAAAGMWSRPDLIGPCDCDRNLYDCRDFQTQDEAQTCFEYCWDTSGRDVHHLDGGGDGRVCESLP
ncbi:MAG: thermonuclease family protein [Candidatus Promineofilum sp.]|nr:thermonuclease family protein [Promineifilum sp.]